MSVAGLGMTLFAFNLFRDCLTDLIFSAGVSWVVADQVIGGTTYFAVWDCG
jgi:hypothetical protein